MRPPDEILPGGSAERWLIFLLRALAVVECAAVAGLVLPPGWMAAAYAWLGLGAFPEAPLFIYFARMISAFYAIHGWLMWVVARDIRRFAPILSYLLWSFALFGAAITVAAWFAGLPWWWLLGEGPFIVACCAWMGWLWRRVS